MKITYTESKSQNNAHQHIHSVDSKVGNHGADAVLHAYEPAFKSHQTKSGRSGPNSYEEISGSQFTDFRSTFDYQKGCLDKDPLDGYEQGSDGQGYTERPCKYPCTFLPVATSICLGGKASCTDTQETEIPIQQVEEHRTDGYASDQSRRISVKVTCHCYIHHADYRHGDIGQNAWYGQFQYILIDRPHSRTELPVFSFFIQHSEVG